MTNQYTWIIEKLDISPTYNSLDDVVRTIYWRIKATDGINETELFGLITLKDPDTDAYVEYGNLTQEIVLDWISQNFDVVNLKKKLDRTLEKMLQPKIISVTPPWL